MAVLLPGKASPSLFPNKCASSADQAYSAPSPWLSGASFILRPSLMRSHRYRHKDVTRRVGDRLFNIME